MPNLLYTYTLSIYDLVGLGFIEGYLMPNRLYTYISSISLVRLGFTAYQPLQAIQCLILYIYIYIYQTYEF